MTRTIQKFAAVSTLVSLIFAASASQACDQHKKAAGWKVATCCADKSAMVAKKASTVKKVSVALKADMPACCAEKAAIAAKVANAKKLAKNHAAKAVAVKVSLKAAPEKACCAESKAVAVKLAHEKADCCVEENAANLPECCKEAHAKKASAKAATTSAK